MNELNYIRSTLSDRDLLEQLAEEAAELSQAALKLIRAQGDTNNPTPVSMDDALDNLEEEFMDVLAVMAAYHGTYGFVMDCVEYSRGRDKWERWYERVKAGQEAHHD